MKRDFVDISLFLNYIRLAMESFQNILVRMPNWIGDLVMATPILTDLRKAYPQATITAMCVSPLSDLLLQDQDIQELFSFRRPSNSFLRREDQRNITEKMTRGNYDAVFLLTQSFSSAWWAWLAGIPRRIGYRGHFRRFLLTDAIALPQKTMHQVDVYKSLLVPFGIPKSQTAPRLYFTQKELGHGLELLAQRGFVKQSLLIGIHPGASYGSAKCWPVKKFRDVVVQLLSQTTAHIVILGGVETIPLAREICLDLPSRVINLAGLTSLRELAVIIQLCQVFVVNDSGPMHIGAALGVKLVALFGSTNPSCTAPYGQQEAVIYKKVSCSPCMKRVCPIDFKCMEQIGVEEVVQKVLMGLKSCLKH